MEAQMIPIDRSIALTALSCLDLTSLNDNEQPHDIQELVERAATIHGPVAAVCVYSKHLDQPYFSVPDARIKVATVVNFPHGQGTAEDVYVETEMAIRHGADGHGGGASQLFGFGVGDTLRIEFEPGPASGNLL